MVAMKALTLPIETETPAFTYGSVLFIGTATTLIRYAGFTVLTGYVGLACKLPSLIAGMDA
jgi:hypothetical protein